MEPFKPFPKACPEGPCLGIDFGKKVVGIAYFHPYEDEQAMPLERIIYQNDSQVISDIKKLCQTYQIAYLVIGLPLYPDGNESKMSERVVKFSKQLRQSMSNIDLYSQDENGSSKEAKELMENSALYNFTYNPQKVDQVSAGIILNRFLQAFS